MLNNIKWAFKRFFAKVKDYGFRYAFDLAFLGIPFVDTEGSRILEREFEYCYKRYEENKNGRIRH